MSECLPDLGFAGGGVIVETLQATSGFAHSLVVSFVLVCFVLWILTAVRIYKRKRLRIFNSINVLWKIKSPQPRSRALAFV